MVFSHTLGFPRIGIDRETKKTVESYWRGNLTQDDLKQYERALTEKNWALQRDAGIHFIPVNDFTWYDHVLDMSVMLGVIPERFTKNKNKIDINTYFCMGRGLTPDGQDAQACEMTKWFDTNYHYIVPEFSRNQSFQLSSARLVETLLRANKHHFQVKPVLLGPLTYLWLGKCQDQFDKLALLDRLLPIYSDIFKTLQKHSVEWIQIDEPILCLDLPTEWKTAFSLVYQKINRYNVKCLIATYFGGLKDNRDLACELPVDGIHIDVCRDPDQLTAVSKKLSRDKVLSLGVIDGRNIWKADLNKILNGLEKIKDQWNDQLWVAPSCSLLHTPLDLDQEKKLDPEVKNWLSFAKQKLKEVSIITTALTHGRQAVEKLLASNQAAIQSRAVSQRIHRPNVETRMKNIDDTFAQRKNTYSQRAVVQKNALKLGKLPTTTIGSFPQTQDIRKIRRDFKSGKITQEIYEENIRIQIADVVKEQEILGIDVLVHGEAERNDMVEYFGEHLDGFVFTDNGWVQSYGSRCVKPPIIYGDVSRPKPMTVNWIAYAQSLTTRLMKGMLTGPVTILAWSFVRDDQPRSETALQIALALRDEVRDLEQAGIKVIQIDEPAFRELLPLRKSDWPAYLDWAVKSFRVASCGVEDQTQIHTHMCYSEFNDMIEAIAALDADVITLESSRSDMELLKAFEAFEYPNDIGPGVYDIHSPRIPTVEDIEHSLKQALRYIPIERLWVNPDCGLKTRDWEETRIALAHMVQAAKQLRG